MCGIAGIRNFDGKAVDQAVLKRMTASLVHRGPDDTGLWCSGATGFGHRRLAIRDLSPAGRQPMCDTDGRCVVVFNGEIYNDDVLRRELERDHGVKFRSRCDTEVLPAGYMAWGTDLFPKLEGMFAIAVWDIERERLLLGRDASGMKPLFLSSDSAGVRFASEIKALLEHPDQSTLLNHRELHTFLALGYPGPSETLLKDVVQLPPGTVRIFEHGRTEDRRFWEPVRRPDIRSDGDALDCFQGAWDKVMADIVASDVGIGVLQSGGIDSSLISMGLKENAECALFTAGFDESTFDETSLASAVAKQAGRPHHVVPVGNATDPEDVLRAVVYHLDGQLADSSAYSLYLLFREVRRHVKVVLAGDGADEFFAGYPTYRATRLADALGWVMPSEVGMALGRLFSSLTRGDERRLPIWDTLSRFCFGAFQGAESHASWRRLLPSYLIPRLYGPALRPYIEVDPLADYKAELHRASGSLLDRCLVADQRFYLPADMLRKVDAMSMAHGLEVRLPFLDGRIMNIAGRVAGPRLSPFGGPDKKLLRRALAATGVEDRVVDHPKRGFNTPIAKLLRTGLAHMGQRLLDTEVDRFSPYLAPGQVRRLWHAHISGSADNGYVLWAFLTFGLWLEQLGVPYSPSRRSELLDA